jgi:hypothetical protein
MFDRTYDRNAMDVAVRRGCAEYQALVTSSPPPATTASPAPPPQQPASFGPPATQLALYALPGALPHMHSRAAAAGGGAELQVPAGGAAAAVSHHRRRARSSSSSPERGGGGGLDGEDTEDMMAFWTSTYAKKERRLTLAGASARGARSRLAPAAALEACSLSPPPPRRRADAPIPPRPPARRADLGGSQLSRHRR